MNDPNDALAFLNDYEGGSASPAEASAEVQAARSRRLSPEDIAAMREQTAGELGLAVVTEDGVHEPVIAERDTGPFPSDIAELLQPAPEEPKPEPFDQAAHEAYLRQHYPHAYGR